MVRIVIGGQLKKQAIEKLVKEIGGNNVEVLVKGDLDAVMAVKNNKADYYIGASETGSGGALAMGIALLGKDKCVTLASPSTIKNKEEIEKEVESGKIAFGFTASTSQNILNILIPYLLK